MFHVVINRTHVDNAALLWWDFINNVNQKKEVIQYPRFIKLIITDLMKKFPDIPQRIEEDYHSIKDDIPLVSVYTNGNVLIQGMLIPNTFLTEEIRATDDFKEYETVLALHKTSLAVEAQENVIKVQEKLDEEEIEKMVKGEEDEESYASVFVDSVFNDDVDDSGTKIEPGSHKEHPKHVTDEDEEIKKEKKDEEVKKEKEDVEIEKEKDIADDGTIREVLDHCNKVLPKTTFAKTNEMIRKEMPHLVNLAVNKDREVYPINVQEMIA
ncbi:hypothetical protein Tco_0775612 [Tanacetum coccineum]